MLCINCMSGKVDVFCTETLPCVHCDGVNVINYNVCQECGAVWKSSGNILLEGTMVVDPELVGTIKDSIEDVFNVNEEVVKVSMKDLVHKCIRCGVMSYEIENKVFHCPECGFEWEIL